jgi:uncharacterized membrane protein
MTQTEQVTTLAATVLTGLLAGTYFAYACSVMPALRRTGDRTLVEVMQKINIVIQNPVFFVAFFGAPAVSAVAVGLHATGWTIAGLVLNAAGLLVTMAANIPLNNALDAAGDPEAIADPAGVRRKFERAWNSWNTARTVLTLAALVCLGEALPGRH